MPIDMNEYDRLDFHSMLGAKAVPDEAFLEEYSIRIGMYHRANGTGALGSIGMIDLIRFLGLTAANPVKSNKPPGERDLQKGQLVVWRQKVYVFYSSLGLGRVGITDGVNPDVIEASIKDITISMVPNAKPGDYASGIDWARTDPGTVVITAPDALVGRFVRCGKEGVIVVEIDGKNHDCSSAETELASAEQLVG